MQNRTVAGVIVALLLVIGALTVIGFVVRALRWLLIVAVLVVIVAAVLGALRGREDDSA